MSADRYSGPAAPDTSFAPDLSAVVSASARALASSAAVSASCPIPADGAGPGSGLDTVACSAATVGGAPGVGAALACHEATPSATTAVTVATPRTQPHLGYLIVCTPRK